MFKKFVIGTGALDMLLGLTFIVQAVTKPAASTYLSMLMVGAFLIFCGAVLVWATFDIHQRASTIFWQGLVRVVAVIGIFAGYRISVVTPDNIPLAIMDMIVAPIYLIGVCRASNRSPWRLLIGRST